MGERPLVADWTRDFDHNHPDWSSDPHAIWDDLRARCPVAHTHRYRGVYLPVRHDDIRTIAYDTEHFSSRRISILEKPPISAPIPPVTTDPPPITVCFPIDAPGSTIVPWPNHAPSAMTTGRGAANCSPGGSETSS